MESCDANRISKTVLSVGLAFDCFSILQIVTSSTVQLQYSSALKISSQMYCRIGICLAPNTYYEAIQIRVSTTGNYTIKCNSTMDTYGFIYNNSFDPSFPNLNLMSSDDESGGRFQFMIIIFLQSMTKYILVATTYFQNVIGPFAIVATGPGLLWFSQANILSKTSSYLGMLLQ